MASRGMNDDWTLFCRMQNIEPEQTLLLSNSYSEREMAKFLSGHETIWTDSSGHGDPPPDFYSDDLGLMADIMMVDDCGEMKIDKHGRRHYVNLQAAAETKVYQELERFNVFDMFPEAQAIDIVPAPMDLIAKQERSYYRYKKEFKRIVGKHLNSVNLYKQNHPGYQSIFLIYDKSVNYMQMSDGKPILHRPFHDYEFMSMFQQKQIEYVVWYMPYKAFSATDGITKEMIQMVIFDVKNIDMIPTIQYEENKIFPIEK